jgi:hypothetical protein
MPVTHPASQYLPYQTDLVVICSGTSVTIVARRSHKDQRDMSLHDVMMLEARDA